MKLPLWSKVIIGLIGIAGATVSTIWGFYEVQDLRQDKKIQAAKEEIYREMDIRKAARDTELLQRDKTVVATLNGFRDQLQSMDSKLNILIARKRASISQGENNETVFLKLPSDVRRNSL